MSNLSKDGDLHGINGHYKIQEKTLTVFIYGTSWKSWIDNLQNLLFIPVKFKGYYVHFGYLQQAKEAIVIIDKILEDNPEIEHLHLKGHSLGGGVAPIVALNYIDKISYLDLYAPVPSVTIKTAKYLKNNIKNISAYTIGADIVPYLPTRIWLHIPVKLTRIHTPFPERCILIRMYLDHDYKGYRQAGLF